MPQDNFNFMDLLEDDTWFEEATRREESVTSGALAGNGWGVNLGTAIANPESSQHLSLLRSMVLQVWQKLVTEWNLGVGAAAAEAKGHELIMVRLHQPELEVQEILIAVLTQKLSQPQGKWQMTEATHEQIRAVLGKVLTPEDWDDIASAAAKAVQMHITSQLQLPQLA